MRLGLAAFALVMMLVGCGPSQGGDDDPGTDGATLVVTPGVSEHVLLNGATATQAYAATLELPDGTQRDVTSETTFSVDVGLGNFTGSTLTVSGAGKGTVLGKFEDKSGTAQIISRVKTVRVEAPLDPSVPDLFQGPEDAARAPSVVYPAPDVIMPRNLGDFEVHWTDGSGNDVFEVALVNEFVDVRVYVAGGNGQAAAGPMPSWTAFQAAEWTAAVGSAPSITYTVRGVQLANPTSVGSTAPRLVKLSNENMEGGIYYWGNVPDPSAGVPYGIFRHDMSKPGQPAEEFMTNVQTGRCVACHVLSRDGTKMAITYDGGNGLAAVVDVATRAPQPDTARWNFGTFTRDGSKFLGVFGGVLTVRDGATQAELGTMPSDGPVSHPDLSADNTRLVYVRHAGGRSDWNFLAGGIYTRTFDPVTNAFGAETPLVVDGNNNFYPSWSPDGQWILFNSGPQTGQTDLDDAYDNASTNLWVVKADGSAPPVELSTLNQTAGLTNAWGRWAPFAQSVGATAEPMYWITVSSKRDFGVRLFGPSRRPQIWMAPFFAGRVGTSDPSTPAFRLPFQNIETHNHIAQWTERIVAPE